MSSKKVLYISSSGTSGKITNIKESTKTNAFDLKGTGFSPLEKSSVPRKKNFDPNSGNYQLTYSNFLKDKSMSDVINSLHKTLSLEDSSMSTRALVFNKMTHYYNRFKLPTVNDTLSKSFSHIFFTRPDCNIFKGDSGNSRTPVLTDELASDYKFRYILNNNINLVRELTLSQTDRTNDFMLSLSNKAASFSLSDEYINSTTYGKTYTGYKIAYGQNNIASKTAGEFHVNYEDDHDSHIYQIHKFWVEYISGVSRGEFAPLTKNIINKVLDYACSCYYFLTAEDNETIIFWSKYYGVFPTNIPSSQNSWSKGDYVHNPSLDISYTYSFKEDYNPMAMLEFNKNAGLSSSSISYVPSYDPKLGHAGTTWVGTPFVELVTDKTGGSNCPYTFKLRFMSK